MPSRRPLTTYCTLPIPLFVINLVKFHLHIICIHAFRWSGASFGGGSRDGGSDGMVRVSSVLDCSAFMLCSSAWAMLSTCTLFIFSLTAWWFSYHPGWPEHWKRCTGKGRHCKPDNCAVSNITRYLMGRAIFFVKMLGQKKDLQHLQYCHTCIHFFTTIVTNWPLWLSSYKKYIYSYIFST